MARIGTWPGKIQELIRDMARICSWPGKIQGLIRDMDTGHDGYMAR